MKNGKYYFTDDWVLLFRPVLKGTLFSKNEGISRGVAETIRWPYVEDDSNINKLLSDDFNNYIFAEHSLYLLKEHFKMILELTKDSEMKVRADKILEKLNKVDDLGRFLEVQDHITTTGKSVYDQAILDIQNGYLSVHCWIRYLFPQLKGLGTSSVTKYFELDDREEALAYIHHPILGDRLIHATKAVLDNKYSIYEILKRPLSIQKFRACMLLFSTISDNSIFKQIINKYKWN